MYTFWVAVLLRGLFVLSCLVEPMKRLCLIAYLLLVGMGLRADGTAAELATKMSTRYAPFANWELVVDIDQLAQLEVARYWRTAKVLKELRDEGDLPLSGLHVALDPGHVGGKWAPYEGRDFSMHPGDFRVREGELTLEVAQCIRDRIESLGAQVTVLRDGFTPINPKTPLDYLEAASKDIPLPKPLTLETIQAYYEQVRNRAVRMRVVVGEIAERARRVNGVIQPDILLSLHINAAPWPQEIDGLPVGGLHLVKSNHVHVLIFGCLSDSELRVLSQQEQLAVKLLNGSGSEERKLATHIGTAMQAAMGLPASQYNRKNAVLLDSDTPTVWARNLMMLRMVECPTVLLEPYVANSEAVYPRIQAALKARANRAKPAEDDILIEYSEAVVAGLVRMYANP